MKYHFRRVLLMFLLLLVSFSLMPAAAQDTTEPDQFAGLPFHRTIGGEKPQAFTQSTDSPVLPAELQQARHAQDTDERAARLETPITGTITALVVLDQAPALKQVNVNGNLTANAAAVASAASSIQAAQAAVAAQLQSVGKIRVLGSLKYSANALAVTMDASQIASVEAIPGVREVIPDQIGYLDNAHSVPFIGTISAWEAAGGYTGSGVKIGIVDSGIDYTHANFGGSGDTSHYDSNDTDDISDYAFDGSKVVGGYDFVGDTWTGGALAGTGGTAYNSLNTYPFGDNDPIDCELNGHGSHVAGTSAGYGVDENGNTYTGPWDSTVPFDSMIIGPGVAPEASLYALKIGGCTSAVSFTAAAFALEFAIDPNGDLNPSDHLDVINNSYGGAYGSMLELLVEQFNETAQAGIIVVASAGNEGDTYFVHGDPGIAEWAISSAASVSDTVYGGLEITTGPAGAFSDYPTVIAASPSQSGATGEFGPMSLKLVGGGINNQGCAVSDYDGFAGEAGLIIWDASTSGCGSAARMTNAVNHGGVGGLVVVSANPADFPFISLACAYNGGDSPIPCVSITDSDGQILADNPSAFTVRFDSTLQAPLSITVGDTLAGFSSRGPVTVAGTNDILVKPDITAPGVAIVSTGVGTGNDSATESGTSMASPHITGVAALMRQVHPDWSVPEIKALMMNTATHDLWTEPEMQGDNYGVSRIGAGRVDVANALNSDVVAYDGSYDYRVSVSFGVVEVVDTVSVTRSITVENKGSSAQSYNLSFQTLNDTPGASFSVSPSSVTVPAGGSVTVQVTLNADKANMANANTPDPTTPTEQNGFFGPLPRHRIMEEGGYVVFTPTTDTSELRVTVHASPRPAADMHADGALVLGEGDTGFAVLPLAGNGVNTGPNYPTDIISEVTALQLVGEDDETLPPEAGDADLQYVGVTSDYLSWLAACEGDTDCAVANTTVYVGFSVYGDWNTLSGFTTYFEIGFDTNENNGYDRIAFNLETGYLANPSAPEFTDTIMSWLATGSYTLRGADFINQLSADTLDTYVFDNSVIVFPVAAATLGLTSANTDFWFDVAAYYHSVEPGDWLPAEAPYWYTYDIAHPAYDFNDAAGYVGGPYGGIPMWDDVDGNNIPVTYDFSTYDEPPGILLLHHHNAETAEVGRAEVVEIERSSELDAIVSKSVDNDTPAEGDTVTFTITVDNDGPAPLQDAEITDTLPNGLTYVSDTCPGTSSQSSVSGGTAVVCDLTGFTIPATFSFSYDLVATVDSGTGGAVLTNTAELTGFNSATTDIEPGNNSGAVQVCVGGTDCNPTPQVDDVYEQHGISLIDNPTVGTKINKVNVKFNVPVRTGTGDEGAGNPDNYRFLAEGTTAGFQTSTCTAPLSSDDAPLGFDVTYNAGQQTSTLDLTGSSLPEGSYRIIVCGSTSIVDTTGRHLNGGTDTVVDFTVNFATGVTTPGGTTPGTASESVLTAEQLAGMQLPSTGETPAWRSPLALVAVLGVSVGIVGLWLYRRH